MTSKRGPGIKIILSIVCIYHVYLFFQIMKAVYVSYGKHKRNSEETRSPIISQPLGSWLTFLVAGLRSPGLWPRPAVAALCWVASDWSWQALPSGVHGLPLLQQIEDCHFRSASRLSSLLDLMDALLGGVPTWQGNQFELLQIEAFGLRASTQLNSANNRMSLDAVSFPVEPSDESAAACEIL